MSATKLTNISNAVLRRSKSRPSDKVRSIRLATDKALESEREEVDLDKEHQHDVIGLSSSAVDEDLLRQERERTDKLKAIEREQEDRVRTQERVQKQMIAEALLEQERKQTDSNLLDERVHVDTELITRDQFLAIVSHDLKNFIVAISIGARVDAERSFSRCGRPASSARKPCPYRAGRRRHGPDDWRSP